MRRRISAVLLSLSSPGLGHLLLGRWQRALVWTVALFASALSISALGFVGVILLGLTLPAAALDALRIRQKPFAKRWLTATSFVALLAIQIAGALLLRSIYLEAFKISAESMRPTLLRGDHVFADKRGGTEPKLGEVIVFSNPQNPDVDYIKRVIALGGQRIAMRAGQIALDGQPIARKQSEQACSHPDDADAPNATGRPCRYFEETLGAQRFLVLETPTARDDNFDEYAVPPGHVYVIGDNRDNSHDSRRFGPVPLSLVKGKVSFVWWSKGREGARTDRLGQQVHTPH